MSKATEREAEKQEAIATLRKILKPGQRVYTSLDRVSSSGMSRRISVIIPGKGRDGQPSIRNISWLVSQATGIPLVEGSLRVGGAGMDMGFHVVYTLGRAMFPKGVHCTGSNGYIENPSSENGYEGRVSKTPRCNSNDHFNGLREYDRKIVHNDSGYVFDHEWI